ncbi:IS110 family transposase [Blastococcus sp. SYSU DS1021]
MLAGIDTHKDTLAVAVIDPAGRPVVVRDLTNPEAGFDALEELLDKHQVRRVGIEGSGNYGRGAAVRRAGRRTRGRGGAFQPHLAGTHRPARAGQDRPG